MSFLPTRNTRNESAALGVSKTAGQVVVGKACRLHESVADCRADEFESAFLEGFAHGIRFGGRGGDLFEGFPPITDRSSINELPDVCVERAEFLLYFKDGTCVGYGGFDFEPVANYAGII
jgi:hypothetical protein